MTAPTTAELLAALRASHADRPSEDAVASLAWALGDAAQWLNALADGGPDLRVKAHVKAAHEAAELAEEPSLEEWADVAICLVGTALQHRWTVDDLAAAVRGKVEVNAARTWEQTPDGSWQHVEVPS